MRDLIEVVDVQAAQQAFALLGGGDLAGQRDGKRVLFETLKHAPFRHRGLTRGEVGKDRAPCRIGESREGGAEVVR